MPHKITEGQFEENYLETPDIKELIEPDEGLAVFESQNARKRMEWASAKGRVAPASWKTKVVDQEELLVQNPPVPVTLEEYMP